MDEIQNISCDEHFTGVGGIRQADVYADASETEAADENHWHNKVIRKVSMICHIFSVIFCSHP